MRTDTVLVIWDAPGIPWVAGRIYQAARKIGFVAGVGSPCCFERKSDGVACVVHDDDFTFEGPADALKKVAHDLRKVWITKVRAMLGPEPEDVRKRLSLIASSVGVTIASSMRQIRGTSRSF